MMQFKEGIWMPGLHEKMRKVMVNAEAIWAAHGEELVITAALDGLHSAGSLHYCGRALDLRTSYFSDQQAVACATTLRASLGRDYDVVLHKHKYNNIGGMIKSGHIHVEYDPKGEAND